MCIYIERERDDEVMMQREVGHGMKQRKKE